MRHGTRITALSLAILCVSLTGLANSGAGSPTAQAGQPRTTRQRTTPPPDARIDINRAGVDELMKVPGMTRIWAVRIVRFRPYHAKNDLLDRGVVTSAVYDRIKNYVIAHRNSQ